MTNEEDGTSCDDGNACTYDTTCTSGSCGGGTSYTCTPTECESSSVCNGIGGCTVTDKSAGTSCGSSADTACDKPDTCNGSGTCLTNFVADSTPCDDGNVCTYGTTCDGSGTCGGGTSYTCTPTECESSSVCDGSGGCNVTDKDAGTSCGSSADTACDNPDTCNGSGTCLANYVAAGTDCGDSGTACVAQDTCDGSGGCHDNGLLACGLINAGGCPIDEVPARTGSDFKLLFTPDVENWVAYKLNASNPGRMVYTLVSEPGVETPANVLIEIPFPFVTQGNMPFHVYDANDVLTNPSWPGCLFNDGAPAEQSAPININMDTWLGATDCTWHDFASFPTQPGVMCPDDQCPKDQDPAAEALGQCVYYFPVTINTAGQFVAELSLDYGLKGKWLDVYCEDESFDRYVPGALGAYGDFDAAGILISDGSSSECNIPTEQEYIFSHLINDDPEEGGTIASVNYFKKPAGIFGRVYCTTSDDGYEGLTVSLWRDGAEVLETTTDEDGMYALNYKHKGKPATYTVKVSNGSVLIYNDVPLQSNGFAEQDFHNNDLECDAADPVWTADPYEIATGKFKTR